MKHKIIDFHIHPYLEQTENYCMFTDDFKLSPTEAAEDLKNAGISKVCGSVINRIPYDAALGYAQTKALNDKALAVKEFYGDFYEPGFHIHPLFVKESLETLEFMHKNGYRLIGELVPYMHGWREAGLDFACKGLQEILDLAGDYGMVFSYHTMGEWQEQMESMIANNPKVTFVAAHPGQKADFLLHLERLEKYDNAYLDLSGTGLFRYGMLREGIRRVGAEKFLFGTDYPITNPGMYVQAVYYEHITDADRELIFSKNAERILGI